MNFQIARFGSRLFSTGLDKIRNIGIIAHIDAGKTTTTERMLYYSGSISKLGDVDQGDTVTDYLETERNRGITIQSAAVTIPWNKYKINLIDTPGHSDFTFEVIRSLRVLDGVVTILDAVAGVEAQTEKVWKQAKDMNIPSIVYINKMDRDGANFNMTVRQIVSKLATRVVLCNIPYFVNDLKTQSHRFVGVVDIFEGTLLKYHENDDGNDVQAIPLNEPSEFKDSEQVNQDVMKLREAAVETLGEFDDRIVDSYLETEDYMKVPTYILHEALAKATISQDVVPIFCGSSFKNIGVQPLMDGVSLYLPNPGEAQKPSVYSPVASVPVKIDLKSGCLINNNKNLCVAFAFKVITHPTRGLLTFVRVYSGILKSNSKVINTQTGDKFNIGKLMVMHGDKPHDVDQLGVGNIGVISINVENKRISTGDTLVCHTLKKSADGLHKNEKRLKLLPIEVPPPMFSVSLQPMTAGDRRGLDQSLNTLLMEDPSLHVHVDEDSGQTILSGMGELHLDIATTRLRDDLGARMEIGKVMINYKETILKPTAPVAKSIEDSAFKKGQFEITLSLDSFQGKPEDTGLIRKDSEGAVLLNDNNLVIFEQDCEPDFILERVKRVSRGDQDWDLPMTMENIQNTILSSIAASLQVGGPVAGLSMHSMIVRVHKWEIPQDFDKISSLVTLIRQAISTSIGQLSEKQTTLMEPIMDVAVHVGDSDLGTVSQDLSTARAAQVHSIDDELDSTSSEKLYWAKDLAESIPLPQDPADLASGRHSSPISGRKVVKAITPLREMMGYLPKLKSLTRGHGSYDMVYSGMQRVSPERLKVILDE
ncbi:hypothetical protein LJB42_000894 [Komagataella kurtzmanii]|nr:hypothetical protein LJB42_000894 [Komagataella kurtzmanii]